MTSRHFLSMDWLRSLISSSLRLLLVYRLPNCCCSNRSFCLGPVVVRLYFEYRDHCLMNLTCWFVHPQPSNVHCYLELAIFSFHLEFEAEVLNWGRLSYSQANSQVGPKNMFLRPWEACSICSDSITLWFQSSLRSHWFGLVLSNHPCSKNQLPFWKIDIIRSLWNQ